MADKDPLSELSDVALKITDGPSLFDLGINALLQGRVVSFQISELAVIKVLIDCLKPENPHRRGRTDWEMEGRFVNKQGIVLFRNVRNENEDSEFFSPSGLNGTYLLEGKFSGRFSTLTRTGKLHVDRMTIR